mgnify:FL=1
MTFQSTFDEFLITQQIKGNTQKTVAYYKNCVVPMINYIGADMDIHLLDTEILRKYALFLRESGICDNSYKTYIKGIKAYLHWLFEEDYTALNFSDKLKLPKAQRKTIDILNPAEIKIILSSFDTKSFQGLRNYCICALMLDSGLRRGEVIRLKVSDVHIFEGYAVINGKGNKQRLVPLGNNSKRYLIKYINLRPIDSDSNALFLTKQKKPITNSTIARIFKTLQAQKVAQGSLTRRIYPHLLRHTFATSYLENGGNIYALQQILGHTTLDMVKKYVHLTQAKTVVNFSNYSPLDNLK